MRQYFSMIINYMTIATMSNYDKICETYDQNDDRLASVHVLKCQELGEMIVSLVQEKISHKSKQLLGAASH